MNVLFFVDLHGSFDRLEVLQEKIKKNDIDLVICAGDMTTFENKLDSVLDGMDGLGVPVLIVHGNHEDEEKTKLYCEMFDNLEFIHGKTKDVKGVLFMGWGGGGFSASDKEFVRITKRFKKKMKKGKTSVLVLHAPPYNTKLDELDNGHHGNWDYRKFIDEAQPDVVVCGHFHENAGKEETIGNSRIINPGPEGKILILE